ncbi:MAG: peptidyl-prolyl cis-trans isomerase [Gemmatimonadaceae bacterium]
MLQSMRSAAKYIWIAIVLVFVIGFVFAQTSGLSSRPTTRGSTVASINGQEITVDNWLRNVQARLADAQKQGGRSLTLDDEQRLKDDLFNSMVGDILLEQEYRRRGITVSDDEVKQAAQVYPPPQFQSNPLFQSEGRFDPEKYRRYLSTPQAKQEGIYAYLEAFYRSEIPKQKLFEQIASTVYITDAQLWRIWEDAHDSAQVSFVAWTPESVPDSLVKVSDEEIRRYYDSHIKDFQDQPGTAVLSVTSIPRLITPADSAAARARAMGLRAEIVGGAKFEDVAKRESADSGSAVMGGSLGKITPQSSFVKEFKDAAFALKVGEISQPVLSQFGYHLIKVDARKGDTATVRHILLRVAQSDSSAARTDKRADSLSSQAGGSDTPGKFDQAVKTLGLATAQVHVTEGQPVILRSRPVPGASAWAFSGAKQGEIGTLIDADDAYYLVRLDSLAPGGKLDLRAAHDEIHRVLARDKKIDLLAGRAQAVSSAVAGGRTLEQAAQAAGGGVPVQKTATFSRVTQVPGLGQLNEAVGAAFGLPVGAVSQPIKTRGAVFVIRTDKRINSDRTVWQAQKKAQREALLDRLRQQRVQEFIASLRESARIVDNRKKIEQAGRQATS